VPKPLEMPAITVEAIAVDGITLSSVNAQVSLAITNPNGVAMPIRGGTWALTVDGAPTVRGQFELGRTIPARASTTVLTRIRVEAGEALTIGTRITEGHRACTLQGALNFAPASGPIKVAFAYRGAIQDVASSRNPLSFEGAQ
jgi:LEA14-like dessication related protein